MLHSVPRAPFGRGLNSLIPAARRLLLLALVCFSAMSADAITAHRADAFSWESRGTLTLGKPEFQRTVRVIAPYLTVTASRRTFSAARLARAQGIPGPIRRLIEKFVEKNLPRILAAARAGYAWSMKEMMLCAAGAVTAMAKYYPGWIFPWRITSWLNGATTFASAVRGCIAAL